MGRKFKVARFPHVPHNLSVSRFYAPLHLSMANICGVHFCFSAFFRGTAPAIGAPRAISTLSDLSPYPIELRSRFRGAEFIPRGGESVSRFLCHLSRVSFNIPDNERKRRNASTIGRITDARFSWCCFAMFRIWRAIILSRQSPCGAVGSDACKWLCVVDLRRNNEGVARPGGLLKRAGRSCADLGALLRGGAETSVADGRGIRGDRS